MEEKGIKKAKRVVKEHWLTVSFFFGFLNDFILLNGVDDVFDNIILFMYVSLAATSLLLFYAGVAQKAPFGWSSKFVKYMPLLMQYSFGGVLSGIFIFYGRSGGWFTNAPFLILIGLVIFTNEFVKKRADRVVYQLSLFFIGLFAYCVLIVPVLSGKMGDWIFVISGIIALLIVSMIVRTLYNIVPNFMSLNIKPIILSLGAVFVGFNILYFTNLIPPIPLSLTGLEIAQAVSRTEAGGYRVTYEDVPWWQKLPLVREEIHPTRSSISCFSRVFAPTRLTTTIYHNWEFKNKDGNWQSHSRIGYPIAGTNRGGYRGYTYITSYTDGVWRCSVETERGQVLGRKVFEVNTVDAARNVVTRIE